MKKLLTIKQQDKRVRILEQARSPYASRINCQVFHKTLRNRIGENIASELENGIEITENNIEYWNDYRQYSSQTNNNPGYWNDYLGPNDNELLDQHNDGEYSVGDMVSAFDYLKYPYDILYLVVDGNYIGGVVTLLTNNMCTEEPKVQIDTVNKKVIYSAWDYSSSFPYNHDGMNTDKLLEEFWKSRQHYLSSGKQPDQNMVEHISKNSFEGTPIEAPFVISYDYTFSIPYNHDIIGIDKVLEKYWERGVGSKGKYGDIKHGYKRRVYKP
jgi:hypothetical protein